MINEISTDKSCLMKHKYIFTLIHYLTPYFNLVNSKLRNKQWNLKRNSYIFIRENAFENVVYEMAETWSRPQMCNFSLGLDNTE